MDMYNIPVMHGCTTWMHNIMVQLNLTISLPLRVVCTQCRQDLKLEGQGPQPGVCVVKCPACGYRVQLIQAPPPAGKPLRLPGQKWTPPAPKT